MIQLDRLKNILLTKSIKNRLIWSVVSSVLLVLANYFVNNWSLFTGENLQQYFFTQVICEKLGLNHKINYDDAFFVNVSYDKQLAKVVDEKNDTIGNTAVTDRQKLYDILGILQKQTKHKYIVLDLRFDKHDITDDDQKLYALICEMDKIVVVRDDDLQFSTPGLYDKSAYADYYSTLLESSFTRFQYLDSKGAQSVPLKVFEVLNPEYTMKRHSIAGIPFYTSGGSLCQCSSFILFDRSKISGLNEDREGNVESLIYFNLGSDLLENKELESADEREQNIIDKAEDAFVIIGNYTEDLHDTYMGTKAGPYILYRALKTLEERSNIVHFWSLVYWCTIYIVIFFFILSHKHVLDILSWMKKNNKKVANKETTRNRYSKILDKIKAASRLFYFFADMLGYAAVLFFFSTLEYIFTNTINSLVLPTIVFMILTLIIDYRNFAPKNPDK